MYLFMYVCTTYVCMYLSMYICMYLGNFPTSCTYHSQLLSPVASSYRTVLHKTPVNSVQQQVTSQFTIVN